MPDDFAAAKLREFIAGEIKDNRDLHPHTGIVEPGSKADEMLSYLESICQDDPDMPNTAAETAAGTMLRKAAATEYVGSKVVDVPSFAVGLTERDVEISSIEAYSRIARSIINEGAPYVGLMFGRMNYGKTSLAGTYLELWKELVPLKYDVAPEDAVVLTNMPTLEVADHIVTDIGEFRRLVFGDDEWFDSNGSRGTPPEIPPSIPKWWHFDECSTHLDARTYGYEVPAHYTPLVKRFAKVKLDGMHLGHSGLDVHPELRRENISTEFIFKTGLKTAEVFNRMMDESGVDLKYELTGIEPTNLNYDPDDFSPWSWETADA